MQHIVQYHINNILFQAQMGIFGLGQTQMSVPKQQSSRQVQQFSPWFNNDESILNSWHFYGVFVHLTRLIVDILIYSAI